MSDYDVGWDYAEGSLDPDEALEFADTDSEDFKRGFDDCVRTTELGVEFVDNLASGVGFDIFGWRTGSES